MKIKRCPNCNHQMMKNLTKKKYECPQCHHEFPFTEEDENVSEFSNIEKLQDAIKVTNINIEVLNKLSRKVLEEQPKNLQANLLLAYTKRSSNPKNFRNAIKTYFLNEKVAKNRDDIVDFMLNNCELKFINALDGALKDNNLLDKYEERLQTVKAKLEKDSENSFVTDCDVFVAYSSNDINKVIPIVDFLEKQGIKCWYSERNMRKNIPQEDDYIKCIKNVISKSKIFLVISSMNSNYNDNVIDEMNWALDCNIQNRIEYIISKSKRTVNFERFFEGRQWIDAIDEDQLTVLSERIAEMLNNKDTNNSINSNETMEETDESNGDNQNDESVEENTTSTEEQTIYIEEIIDDEDSLAQSTVEDEKDEEQTLEEPKEDTKIVYIQREKLPIIEEKTAGIDSKDIALETDDTTSDKNDTAEIYNEDLDFIQELNEKENPVEIVDSSTDETPKSIEENNEANSLDNFKDEEEVAYVESLNDSESAENIGNEDFNEIISDDDLDNNTEITEQTEKNQTSDVMKEPENKMSYDEALEESRKLLENDNYQQVIDLLRPYEKTSPAYFYLAKAYLGIQNYTEAYKSALNSDEKELADFYNDLGKTVIKENYTHVAHPSKLFKKAIQYGNNKAYFNLGVIYSTNSKFGPKDLNKAFLNFKSAYNKGINPAFDRIALIAEDTDIDPLTSNNILLFLNKLEEENNIDAIMCLARFYRKGILVLKDVSMSIAYYKKAESLGNSEASNYIKTLEDNQQRIFGDCALELDTDEDDF